MSDADKHVCRFKPEKRAAIKGILLAVKRLFNAPANSKEEGRAAEAIIDLIETTKDF